MRTPDISLTTDEVSLFEAICFNWESHDDLRNSIEPMVALGSSILRRGVVPAIRLAYFTDPEFNPGGRGRSRQDVFEKNGTSGVEVLGHPNFLSHLEYFICGPDLPSDAIERFKRESAYCHLSGSDVIDLMPFARSCVRRYSLDPYTAADEFFKLAVECGAMPGFADNLRKSVRAIKPHRA